MKTSEHTNEIFAALAKAQAEYEQVRKSKTVRVQTSKGRYEYKYAPLDQCLAMIRPIFAKHGLALMQSMEGMNILLTRIGHQSGQWIEGETPVIIKPPPTDPKALMGYNHMQEMGKAMTYSCRYGLRLGNIITEEDTDATGADHQRTTHVDIQTLSNSLLEASQHGIGGFNSIWRSLTPEQKSAIPEDVLAQCKKVARQNQPTAKAMPEPPPQQKSSDHITDKQRKMLEARISKSDWDRDEAKLRVQKLTGAEHFSDILKADFQDVLDMLFPGEASGPDHREDR